MLFNLAQLPIESSHTFDEDEEVGELSLDESYHCHMAELLPTTTEVPFSQVAERFGISSKCDELSLDPDNERFITSLLSDGTPPEERLRLALDKYKQINSTKPHHVLAQIWDRVSLEDDFVLRPSGRYALGIMVNNDLIKRMSVRYVYDSFKKVFHVLTKTCQSAGIVDDEDTPQLSNLDVGSFLVNRWVAYKAFQLGKVQWAPNFHIYSRNCEPEYMIFGTLALPVFDCISDHCVGVFELLIDRPCTDYVAAEVEEICKLLQEVGLRAEGKLPNQPRQIALLEIMNMMKNTSQMHNLPLAQTWLPCKCYCGTEISQTMQICMSSADIPFILMDSSLFPFWKASSMYHMCEGQGVAGRAFLSKASCFCNDITQFSDQNFPLVHTTRMFPVYSSLAICLKSSYTGEEIYIVQFFLRNRLGTIKERKNVVDTIIKSITHNFRSLSFASSELEEIDARLGKITKRKCLSNVCMVEDQLKNVVSSSKTCGVRRLSEDMVHEERGPLVELNGNKDGGHKKVRKKKTQNVVSSKEDLLPYLRGTREDAAKALGVSRSTIKRLPQQFGYKNWSDARKSSGLPPAKRTNRGHKCQALVYDDPTSSSGI